MKAGSIARVGRSRDEARAAYDRMSRFYDLIAAGGERRFILEGLRMLDAHEGERILEVGFGTGGALLALARSVGATGCVHGIDISAGMASIARKKLERQGLSGRVVLDVGDATELPYGNGSFDAVFMSFTLELFDTPEIPRVLAECSRVLVHGGLLCVVSMSAMGGCVLTTGLYLRAHGRFPEYVDCRPILAKRAIEEAAFDALVRKLACTWGLPVEMVLARIGVRHPSDPSTSYK